MRRQPGCNQCLEVMRRHPRPRQVVDAQPQRSLVRLDRNVADQRTIDVKRRAAAPLADTMRRLDGRDELALSPTSQSFFDSTSCRICFTGRAR
jgi:hypothetical protein